MSKRAAARIRTSITVVVTSIIVVLVIAATIHAASRYFAAKSSDGQRSCTSVGQTYTVMIRANVVNPAHIDARKCDRLTIVNGDDQGRLIAFGQHDHHVAYDGVTTQYLAKDQSASITLSQIGAYRFHDHYHDATAGTFTVSR